METIGQQPRKPPGPGRAVPRRGHAVQAAEWIAERLILAVAVLASTAVLLIFVFVGREALPVLLGSVTTVNSSEVIRPQDIGTVSPERLRSYLGLSPAEFRSRDLEALRLLLEVRAEAIAEEAAASGPAPNAAALPMLFLPYRWNGYPTPAYVWQPGLWSPKYNVVPLLLGSLKVTVIAMSVAVPLALAAALHVSQLASSRFRAWAKPAVELLSGVPGVVLGSLALMAFAPVFQRVSGTPFLLNATVAGVVLGVAVVPLVFSLSEDSLSGVPVELMRAALALGATRWQAAWHVALPAALPGIASAVVLGFGRALGETMIVLIASGNAPILGWNPLRPVRTITATIAAELGETAFYGHHYRMLFLLGTMLFVVTFAINLAASAVFRRLRRGTEGAV
jgi:phosphate transport system permease protein